MNAGANVPANSRRTVVLVMFVAGRGRCSAIAQLVDDVDVAMPAGGYAGGGEAHTVPGEVVRRSRGQRAARARGGRRAEGRGWAPLALGRLIAARRGGCSLFSGISVTASKSTPPSVCLGSFPPFQGVGKNFHPNPGDHPDPANSQVQVDQLSHPLIRPTFSPKPCAFSETPAFHHRRVPLGEFRLP